MKNFRFYLLVLTTMCFVGSQAQVGGYFEKFRPSKKWSVGLQISPTHLNGDADDAKIGLSYGAHVKYSISQSFALKLNGDMGTLRGGRLEHDFSGNKNNGRWGTNSVVTQNPNNNRFTTGNQAPTDDAYQFTNSFRDLNINAVYTLGNLSFLRPLRKLQMFTFFGAGVIWSEVDGNFENADNPALATKTANLYYNSWGDEFLTPVRDGSGNLVDATTYYKGRNFTIPFGLGIKRNFGQWFDLGLEWRSHWTRSDHLDAFSFPIWRNRYADFYTLVGLQGSVKLGAKGQKEHYDWLNPMETVYEKLGEIDEIKEKLEKMSGDADGDGVSDYFDKEEDSPCSKVYGDGTVIDTDGDGVNDCDDLQPASPCDKVDANGVALDTDKDGVSDCFDSEPNSAPGVMVDGTGKTFEMPADNGSCCNCDNITLPAVIFKNGSSKISPEYYGTLYTIAEKMKQCPGLNVSATGYVASKSGDQLTWKRTNAIMDHLESNYGIDRSRISGGSSPSTGVEYGTRRIDFNQIR